MAEVLEASAGRVAEVLEAGTAGREAEVLEMWAAVGGEGGGGLGDVGCGGGWESRDIKVKVKTHSNKLPTSET